MISIPSKSAFLFVCLLSVFSYVKLSTNRKLIRCPCGNTGRNVTITLNGFGADNPCSKLENCKKCQDGLNHCLKCPEGLKGPFCSITMVRKRSFRQKRQSYSGSAERLPQIHRRQKIQQGTCPDLEMPKLGSIRCIYKDGQKNCTGKCLPGYHFENRETETEIVLTCNNGVWFPSEFPKCKSGGLCELEMDGAGFYNCTSGIKGTRCDIHCAQQYQGIFDCFPGRSWNPPLPDCVKPKDEQSKQVSHQGCHCENDGTCDKYGACICPVGKEGKFCEKIILEILCPDPGPVANAESFNVDGSPVVDEQKNKIGQSIVFSCFPGFYLNGRSIIVCLKSGLWSHSLPVCERPPSSPENQSPSPTLQPMSVVVQPTYSVDRFSSYAVLSPSSAVQSPSSAVQLPSSDVQSPSSAVLSPPSAVQSPSSAVQSPSSDVQSPSSAVHSPSSAAQSPSSAVQSPSSAVQSPFSAIQSPSSADQSTSSAVHSTSSAFKPLSSAVKPMPSADQSLPSEIGTATDNIGNIKYCLNPGGIENGHLTFFPNIKSRSSTKLPSDEPEYPQGTRLQYMCGSGHTLHGSSSSVCEDTGYWSAHYPKCIATSSKVLRENTIYCDHPGSILDGKMKSFSPEGESSFAETEIEFPEGTRLEYSCEKGLYLRGSSELVCLSTGDWSTNPPFCSGGTD